MTQLLPEAALPHTRGVDIMNGMNRINCDAATITCKVDVELWSAEIALLKRLAEERGVICGEIGADVSRAKRLLNSLVLGSVVPTEYVGGSDY